MLVPTKQGKSSVHEGVRSRPSPATARRAIPAAGGFQDGERALTPDAQPGVAGGSAGAGVGRGYDHEAALLVPAPLTAERDATAFDPVVRSKLASESAVERDFALDQVDLIREVRAETLSDLRALAAPTDTREWGPYYTTADVDRVLKEHLIVTIVGGKIAIMLDLGPAGGGVQRLAEAGLAGLAKTGPKLIAKQLLKLAGAGASVLQASGILLSVVSFVLKPVELGQGDQVRRHMTDEEILALIVRRLADRAAADVWLEAQRRGAGRDAVHQDKPIGELPTEPTTARDVTGRPPR